MPTTNFPLSKIGSIFEIDPIQQKLCLNKRPCKTRCANLLPARNYDYRYRQVSDPLYEQMRQWKAGELRHHDIDQAIHATHKKNQELYILFTNQRGFLISMIQMDRDWFEPWLVEHPAPEGVALVRPL